MKCKKCGSEMPEGTNFCTKCGEKLEPEKARPLFCTKCGKKLQAEAMFCTGCGAAVKDMLMEKPKATPKPAESVNAGKNGEEPVKQKPVQEPAKPVQQEPAKPVQQEPAKQEPMQRTQHQMNVNPVPQPVNYVPMQQPVNQNGKKGKLVLIITIIVLILILLGVGSFGVIKYLETKGYPIEKQEKDRFDDEAADDKQKDKDTSEEVSEDVEVADATDEASTEAATTEAAAVDLSKVDFDLSENDVLSLKGTIMNAAVGGKVLVLRPAVSFYTKDETGTLTLVENVENIVIDDEKLPQSALEALENGAEVEVAGPVSVKEGRVVITANSIMDTKGKDVTDDSSDEDYVIPESSDVYLTEKDIAKLTLREVNYAKNEIYARHGYIFKSKELKDYFESKEWYKPVAGEGKFSETVFSKIERANITLLKEREFSMEPGGYQLDQ